MDNMIIGVLYCPETVVQTKQRINQCPVLTCQSRTDEQLLLICVLYFPVAASCINCPAYGVQMDNTLIGVLYYL